MTSTVQLNAYTLLVITNKAKSKFKAYCLNVKQYPFSSYICHPKKIKKTFFGYEYTSTESVPLTYEEQLNELVNGSNEYRHPMYSLLLKYNEAASRSRLSNTDVTFNIPFNEYKKIIDIAEYGNYENNG